MIRATSKGFRLHIGFFGRRNVGKSSLLNAITQQKVSIVSEVAGTTTDPVEKPMELLPIGPVLFVDTAGVDDVGALGEQRIEDAPGHRAFRHRRARGRVRCVDRLRREASGRTSLAWNPRHGGLEQGGLVPSRYRSTDPLRAGGLPYVKLVATTGEGLDTLRAKLWEVARSPEPDEPQCFCAIWFGPTKQRCW
jgi:hypothetical protein